MFWGAIAMLVTRVGTTFFIVRLMRANEGVQFVSLAASLVSMAGVWLMTSPDPAGLNEAQHFAARKLVRAAVAISLAFSLTSLILRMSAMPPAVRIGLQVVYVIAGVAAVVGEFARFSYLGMLARRVPDDALASRARILMYGLGSAHLLILTMSMWMIVSTMLRSRPAIYWYGMVSSAIGLLFIILTVAAMNFYARFAKVLRKQSAAAEWIWSNKGATS
jgi:hypothetical protein